MRQCRASRKWLCSGDPPNVPRPVLERAKDILGRLEVEHLDPRGGARISRRKKYAGGLQLTLFTPPDHPLLAHIRAADIDNLTPLAELALIRTWQEELGGKTS